MGRLDKGPRGDGTQVFLRRRKLQHSNPGAFALEGGDARGIPEPYRGGNSPFFRDIYDSDHVEARHGGRFRWLLSTCLAATVGAVAILVVVYGSSDQSGIDDKLLPEFKKILEGTGASPAGPALKNAGGLKWVTPKTDRMQLTSGALSTRYIIHELSKQRRDGREYMRQKPYARIVARLASVPANYADVIPPFNPFKLYASNQPVTANDDDESAGSGLARSDVSIKVVELLGGILPEEDGQELGAEEVQDLVEHSAGSSPGAAAAQEPAASGVPLDAIPEGATASNDKSRGQRSGYGRR